MIGLNVNGYKIKEFRGQGSFGSVYKCEKNNREYAIKIFSLQYVYAEFKNNPEHNRITQEVEVLRRVNHENIVKIYGYGSFINLNIEYLYVVMEYLNGKNLKETIEETGKFDVERTSQISKQIIIGLDQIHQKDIIHRDLKPENIFLTTDGTIKIVDFGLSKLIDFSSITSTGAQIGSPLYMAPEQIKDSKNIDYRSDYYAFGIILFEMLTGKHPYGDVSSREQLFYKIINEKPLSILQFDPSLSNTIDNLINKLLEKSNYKRPNKISLIIDSIDTWDKEYKIASVIFEPTFFLRVYNEKKVLKDFNKDGYNIDYCIYPINHQNRQKGLLKHLQDNQIPFMIDPSTMRLAYDTFADVKGLVELPYSPEGYNKLELNDFDDIEKKQNYVNLVINEQLKHNPTAIITPFHMSNNSNLMTIKNESREDWFLIDIKLLKESKSFLDNQNIDLPLVGGFCIKTDILTSKEEQEYFLNVLSGLPCDYYLIYVDCIDYSSNSAQLFHYIKTLYLLQQSTGKPVIAGRVNTIGLLLLSFGIHGFESGTARFESFYEGLYSEKSEPYNMFVMYYIPELLRNIAVKRKDPSKIFDILENKAGKSLRCECPYCKGKNPDEVVVDEITKKHFLYRRQKEIKEIQELAIPDRLSFFKERIENALEYYKNLKPVFKTDDYAFLSIWKKIISDLRVELKL